MGRKKKRGQRRPPPQQPRPAAQTAPPPDQSARSAQAAPPLQQAEPSAGTAAPPARRYVLKIPLAGLSVVLLLVLLMLFNLEELYEYENKAQDFLTVRRYEGGRDEIVVVMIDDEDYKFLFKETSPLPAKTLGSVVAGIRQCGPAVVGVDVATDDKRFGELVSVFGPGGGEGSEGAARLPPVVWVNSVYDFVPVEGGGLPLPLRLRALGGNVEGAMPTLLDDEGGVTRYYQRRVPKADGETLPSFAQAVLEAAGRLPEDKSTDRRVIRYARRPDAPDEEAALNRWTELKSSEFAGGDGGPRCPNKDGLANKIVLLGGSYLGGERHETPLGQMSGILIWANVVDTELSGGGLVLPSEWILAPLWVVQGVLLVLVFQRFPLEKSPLRNLGLSLALVVVTSAAGAVVAALVAGSLNPLHYAFYFLPVGLAALLLHVADAANDWRKKKIAKALGQAGPGG